MTDYKLTVFCPRDYNRYEFHCLIPSNEIPLPIGCGFMNDSNVCINCCRIVTSKVSESLKNHTLLQQPLSTGLECFHIPE